MLFDFLITFIGVDVIKNRAIYLLLYLLPKNFVSALMGKLVSIRWPKPMMLVINKAFVRIFKIDLKEALLPLPQYETLQDLFIRRLKPGLRKFAESGVLSPCDGMVSIADKIVSGQLIQAKGRLYSLKNLMQDQEQTEIFKSGSYATIYLSPKDYHRFHMPIDGQIEKTIYIPGNLWPVNNWAVANVSELFCQNERVITLIRTEKGMLAHIAVGATMVGKIDMDYCTIPDYKKSKGKVVLEHGKSLSLRAGDDLGKFMFGSTIILLFSEGMIDSFAVKAPTSIRVGELLGRLSDSLNL